MRTITIIDPDQIIDGEPAVIHSEEVDEEKYSLVRNLLLMHCELTNRDKGTRIEVREITPEP